MLLPLAYTRRYMADTVDNLRLAAAKASNTQRAMQHLASMRAILGGGDAAHRLLADVDLAAVGAVFESIQLATVKAYLGLLRRYWLPFCSAAEVSCVVAPSRARDCAHAVLEMLVCDATISWNVEVQIKQLLNALTMLAKMQSKVSGGVRYGAEVTEHRKQIVLEYEEYEPHSLFTATLCAYVVSSWLLVLVALPYSVRV
jgi:hypothetical protein